MPMQSFLDWLMHKLVHKRGNLFIAGTSLFHYWDCLLWESLNLSLVRPMPIRLQNG